LTAATEAEVLRLGPLTFFRHSFVLSLHPFASANRACRASPAEASWQRTASRLDAQSHPDGAKARREASGKPTGSYIDASTAVPPTLPPARRTFKLGPGTPR
jgi:hypothetical protein